MRHTLVASGSDCDATQTCETNNERRSRIARRFRMSKCAGRATQQSHRRNGRVAAWDQTNAGRHVISAVASKSRVPSSHWRLYAESHANVHRKRHQAQRELAGEQTRTQEHNPASGGCVTSKIDLSAMSQRIAGARLPLRRSIELNSRESH
eukprot:6173474-Pleurochrysis_carterae.AAC.4